MAQYRLNGGARHHIDGGKSTLCKCPLCGKMHRKMMNWKGRGVPKVYCDKCQTNDVVHYIDVRPYIVHSTSMYE